MGNCECNLQTIKHATVDLRRSTTDFDSLDCIAQMPKSAMQMHPKLISNISAKNDNGRMTDMIDGRIPLPKTDDRHQNTMINDDEFDDRNKSRKYAKYVSSSPDQYYRLSSKRFYLSRKEKKDDDKNSTGQSKNVIGRSCIKSKRANIHFETNMFLLDDSSSINIRGVFIPERLKSYGSETSFTKRFLQNLHSEVVQEI